MNCKSCNQPLTEAFICYAKDQKLEFAEKETWICTNKECWKGKEVKDES